MSVPVHTDNTSTSTTRGPHITQVHGNISKKDVTTVCCISDSQNAKEPLRTSFFFTHTSVIILETWERLLPDCTNAKQLHATTNKHFILIQM